MSEPLGLRIGIILSRVLVPAWVAMGALFKLSEATPRNLPAKTVLVVLDKLHIDLYLALAGIIGIELAAVAVMVCAARLARPVAMALLSIFCVVLIGEMVQGNVTSCGCMGDVKVPPWLMFSVDCALLLGVMIFSTEDSLHPHTPKWPVVLAGLLGIVGFVGSFWYVLRARPSAGPGIEVVNGPTPRVVPAGPNANPSPLALPSSGYYLVPDVKTITGKVWKDLDLFKFMQTWPKGLDHGKRYVVFYSRTCDHCQEMFEVDLIDAGLSSMVTAVEVPDSATVMTSPNAWDMPQTDVEHLQLPLGVTWVITTPLTLRIVDGVIQCATEGEHRKCMELEN